ncbi:Gfo/Idh/MocA family oxidoreductase [Streptomyces sp. N50]|uniref:Gfo/Idh/MocA family protein n=1 Tax=Streptomyces sp. N50 TaxID=3081765 RepID=UPI0029624203|nr:Gfo/Idh/MocA family oxidoreductase [Streptomyces sp. N50]WOX16162.1 Gfo/Idh/MocA family oxidoreductase [Streptomyces sp. N50]
MNRSTPRARIGVVGAGMVFDAYARGLAWYGDLPIIRIADIDVGRARAKAEQHGIPAYGTPAELYADPDVDVVVNITPPVAHWAVTRDALAAGKHVYSEKPLAATVTLARENLAQAKAAGRVLAGAPDTFLGTAGQTARAAIDGGLIGTPFAATSFVRSSKVEAKHPNPGFFFQPGGGPTLDWGPYHVAALVNLLGPVAEVVGTSTIPSPRITVTTPDRVVDEVEVTVPTTVAAILRTTSGAIVSTLYSFDIWDMTLPHIEVYGTEGTLNIPDPNRHDAPVLIKRRTDTDWSELPPVIPPTRAPEAGPFRGHGVNDLVESLRGQPLRVPGEFALHVLEVLEAIEQSTFAAGARAITSRAERPAPAALPQSVSA